MSDDDSKVSMQKKGSDEAAPIIAPEKVSTEEDGCLRRIDINGKVYYIKATFSSPEVPLRFSIELTDGLSVWRGEAMGDMLKKLIPNSLNKRLYMAHLRGALSGADGFSGSVKLQMSAQKNNGEVEFSWKIFLQSQNDDPDDAVSINGQLNLPKVRDSRAELAAHIDQLIHRKDELRGKCVEFERFNESLTRRHEQLLQNIEHLQEEKKQMERDLYEIFTKVLNEKKKKIRELKEEIDELNKTGSKKRRISAASDDSDSEKNEMETDIRGESSEEERERKPSILPPSGSPLLEPADVAPVTVRRRVRLDPTSLSPPSQTKNSHDRLNGSEVKPTKIKPRMPVAALEKKAAKEALQKPAAKLPNPRQLTPPSSSPSPRRKKSGEPSPEAEDLLDMME